MARNEAPPFARGATYYNGGLIETANLGGSNLMGKEWVFEDTTYGTNQYVTVRVIRNTGTAALLGGRFCAFDPAYPMNAVNGYVATTAGVGAILDEFLGPGGLLPNDLGYVIVQGPTIFYTPLDGGADNVIAAMDPVAALTAVTTGAVTAGRLVSVAAGSTNTRDALLNTVGHAISAKTTGNTNAACLVIVVRSF